MFSGLQFGSGVASSMAVGADGLAKVSRQEEKHTLLPTTVRGIEHAFAVRRQGEELRFYGCLEPTNVLVVAMVEAVDRRTASLELQLNDGTGRIVARYFMSCDLPGSLDQMVPGSYVCAVGSVRVEPELHLGVVSLRAVQTHDEVSYHMIECAHAMLRATRGLPKDARRAAAVEQQPVDATPSPKTRRSAVETAGTTPPKEGAEVPGVSEAAAAVTAFYPPLATPLAKAAAPPSSVTVEAAVLQVMECEGRASEAGVSLAELLARVGELGATTTEQALRKHLEDKIAEGLIFNTTDDDHFAPI